MKGFGSGLIWGGVVGALGLVIASENAPLPAGGEAPAEVAAPEIVAPAAPDPATPAAIAAQPEQAEASEAPQPETAPAPAPDTNGATATTGTTDAPLTEMPAQAGNEAPRTGGSPAPAETVEVPAASEFAKPPPETDPAVPDTAAAPQTTAVPLVEAPAIGQSAPQADTAPSAAPSPDLTEPAASQAPAAEMTAPAVTPAPAPPAAPSMAAAPAAPSAEPAPDTADLPPPPPLTPQEQALLETAPEEPPEPQVEMLIPDMPLDPVDPSLGSEIGAAGDAGPVMAPDRPTAGFEGEVAGVVTGRLPRIGDAPAGSGAGADEDVIPDSADLPPMERFARPFDNPDGKPTFAIILIDRGDPALDRAALASLPFPVTIVLDPTLPSVADLAAVYLGAGQEVAMLATGIPAGATAADLEVTFAAHANALPEAVAVIDMAEGGFQGNRPLATQVVPIIKGQGRGLLTYDGGLNPAEQVASREGLPSATIFRRLDAQGEPASAIRRYLDRAVFKAAQEGRVAVIGDARPETIAALMEWTVEGRASAVALAPASAVMVAP